MATTYTACDHVCCMDCVNSLKEDGRSPRCQAPAEQGEVQPSDTPSGRAFSSSGDHELEGVAGVENEARNDSCSVIKSSSNYRCHGQDAPARLVASVPCISVPMYRLIQKVLTTRMCV